MIKRAKSILAEMGIPQPEVSTIRSKAGVHVFRAESGGESIVLKLFDNQGDRREIGNYKLLTAIGVPTLPMLSHTDCALLLPDIDTCEDYRLGTEADMSDENTARAVAKWYRKLHEKGREYLLANNADLYDENDCITLESIEMMAGKTGTQGSRYWRQLRDCFGELRRRQSALPRTLTYNDFYWTNLVVARDGSSAMMFDFNLLGKGYAYADIRNVTSSLSEAAQRAFLDEYGADRLSAEEQAADKVLEPLVSLHYACLRGQFPSWVKHMLDDLSGGALLDDLQKWLDSSKL